MEEEIKILPKIVPDKKPAINPEEELVPDQWPDETPLPNPKA